MSDPRPFRPRPFRLGVHDPLLVLPGDDDVVGRRGDGDEDTDDTEDTDAAEDVEDAEDEP